MFKCCLKQQSYLANGQHLNLSPLDFGKIVSTHRKLFDVTQVMRKTEDCATRPENVVTGRIWKSAQSGCDIVPGHVRDEFLRKWCKPVTGPSNITLIVFASMFFSFPEKPEKLRNRNAGTAGLGNFHICLGSVRESDQGMSG
jgi:hypothetical protein